MKSEWKEAIAAPKYFYKKRWKRIECKYQIKQIGVRQIDIRKIYPVRRPCFNLDSFFGSSGLMIESPHVEFAKLYYNHGLKWIKENYNKTRLCILKTTARIRSETKIYDQSPIIPLKEVSLLKYCLTFTKLCESMQRGYLRKGHDFEYIAALDVPLCNSRYNFKEDNKVPEIFLGHHRTGALLALGVFIVPLIFVKDEVPGSCYIKGNRKYAYEK